MRVFRTILTSIGGLGILAASTLPAGAMTFRAPVSAPRENMLARSSVAAVPRSRIPLRDFGRRSPLEPVTVTVVLRYNHEAELDSLIELQGDPASPLHGRFLTSAQFDSYFAPTPAQHAYVVERLQAAGLHVVGTFPNRTVIDVEGASGDAERFFETEIHSVVQGSFGARFTNVKPASVPATLGALVRTVSLSNLVNERPHPPRSTAFTTRPQVAVAAPALGTPGRRVVTPGQFTIVHADVRRGDPMRTRLAAPATSNLISDPGFESGGFGDGWQQCETSTVSPGPSITSTLSDGGKYSGLAGSAGTSEQLGYAGVCQLVTIPANGVLSADVHQVSNETSASYAGQDAFLIGTNGHIVAILAQTVNNKAGWVTLNWNLKNFVGQNVYVYFGVHGDGAKSFSTKQYVDNVSLSSETLSSPIPTPTGNISTSCKGSAENGPLTQTDGDGFTGFLATSVAKAFDFPVQHGCNGAGETAAIVISNSIRQSDINLYMKASGVTQIGKITNVPVDGGGPIDNDGEASLDTETVIGLAPAANVNVYGVPDLSAQHTEDAYNRVVSDNTAVAVNSSFGGCESDDPTDDEAADAIYVQGAALGITFVGTSGDNGSNECNDGPGGAASKGVSSNNSPHSVSIGSVGFTESSAGVLESITTASDPAFGFLSGGGVSDVYALPRYQSGVTNAITTGRNQPDLSLPGDRVAVFTAGVSSTNDGTSWSGPEFTALLTTAAQLHGTRGFGFANPLIYGLFKSSGYTDFIDSTTGNNGAYAAKTGYDQVTGIGVPKGYTFAAAL
jgi:subtilase family serine protease